MAQGLDPPGPGRADHEDKRYTSKEPLLFGSDLKKAQVFARTPDWLRGTRQSRQCVLLGCFALSVIASGVTKYLSTTAFILSWFMIHTTHGRLGAICRLDMLIAYRLKSDHQRA